MRARWVKPKWGKLTADDLTAINGRREELEGKINSTALWPNEGPSSQGG